MLDVRRVIRRLGETLREMGLLMMVFAPLDALFAERSVTPQIIAGVFIAGVIFVVCGILISESR